MDAIVLVVFCPEMVFSNSCYLPTIDTLGLVILTTTCAKQITQKVDMEQLIKVVRVASVSFGPEHY